MLKLLRFAKPYGLMLVLASAEAGYWDLHLAQ